MKIAISILLFIFLASCNKNKNNLRDYPDLVGAYEWVHSYNANNTSESGETLEENYAIILKKNGKIRIYQNGDLTHEGYCRHVSEYSSGSLVSYSIDTFKDTLGWFKIEDGILKLDGWPIENSINDFQMNE